MSYRCNITTKSYRTKIGIKLGANRTIYSTNKEEMKFIF